MDGTTIKILKNLTISVTSVAALRISEVERYQWCLIREYYKGSDAKSSKNK